MNRITKENERWRELGIYRMTNASQLVADVRAAVKNEKNNNLKKIDVPKGV
jgi:hypothetical protein